MKQILKTRAGLISSVPEISHKKSEEEGGCGVVGFAATLPVKGKHIFAPSIQMHNRGNGKGGGIAAACLTPEQLGIDSEILRNDYILQIALLDSRAEKEVEKTSVIPNFEIHHKTRLKPAADYRDLGLEIKPPDIVRYFVRVKEKVLHKFIKDNNLGFTTREFTTREFATRPLSDNNRKFEDEFIYRNSFRLNQRYYTSLGEKRAFVLSHARNLLIFKIVGYAEKVVQYYGLENFQAQVWIAHQRYPTRGKVWHPAGAHPFIGMNEALVHNGDFANYYSVTEYLRQHNIVPQFLTDTEVSVLLFDLLNRIYEYPMEYIIEAIAPTTELDFDKLPHKKQRIYRAIQSLHIHGSPDGPWFFIISRSDPDNDLFQLLGITDTSMLRPQVFAIQESCEVSIGLIASEKQAIDAILHSLHKEDPRFGTVADHYWNARGGSHTDGGAFSFTLNQSNNGSNLTCTDKFGRTISSLPGEGFIALKTEPEPPEDSQKLTSKIRQSAKLSRADKLFNYISGMISRWNFDNIKWMAGTIKEIAESETGRENHFEWAIEFLSLLIDRRYDCGNKKRGRVIEIIDDSIKGLLDSLPLITDSGRQDRFLRIDWNTRHQLRAPKGDEALLVISAGDFPPEGDDCDSRLAVKAYKEGWKRFIFYGLKGQRFTGCGFGPGTDNVRIDIYGSSGDYVASGIDGMNIHIHGNGQDQLAQIMKSGKVVIFGDAGQTFMYGAKGGEVYVMGNAAGRPLINAVGRPRVVINGTCLDFLAESFMAGDPHNNGGFVILNGIEFDEHGVVREQETPYPGSNLFSLASGGAIFLHDPYKKIIAEQLNGGEFAEFTDRDWKLIFPYLETNERYFGISVKRDLLTIDGEIRSPLEVYRKVKAVKLDVLAGH